MAKLSIVIQYPQAHYRIKPENLADTLQVCIDSGAKKILMPIISAEDAVFKALGVE